MGQEHQALTLSDLRTEGGTFTPEEAVAITLAVAERLGWSEPPSGGTELIVIRGDGTVHLPRAVDAAPATPGQYADLLQRLLAFGRDEAELRVPGPLLLLVARARGEIDLPPFASADEFRHALMRFLSRPVSHVISAAMTRWRPAQMEAPPAAPRPERRTAGPRVDELRRLLRESDLERIALTERLRQESPQLVRRESAAVRPPVAGSALTPAARMPVVVQRQPAARVPLAVRAQQPAARVPARVSAAVATHSERETAHSDRETTRTESGLAIDPPARGRGSHRRLAAVVVALVIAAGGLFWSSLDTRSGSAPDTTVALNGDAPERTVASNAEAPARNGDAPGTGASEASTPAIEEATLADRSEAPPAPVAAAFEARTEGPAQTPANAPAQATAQGPTHGPSQGSVVSLETERAQQPAPQVGAPSALVDASSGDRPGAPRAVSSERLHTLPLASPTAYSPSFSPDGQSVYFHSGSRDGSRLMRADTNDSGDVREVATIVDDGAQNFHVRLSPDGSRVAFDSDRDGVRGVYVAGRNGTNVRRVSGPDYSAVPVWSPDGRELLYVGAEPRSPRTWNLWRLTLESGAKQQLTFHRYGQSWPGSWFADGQRICYTHEDRVYVLDLRTGAAQSIASPVPGRLVRTAAVSPNGSFVVFQVYRDGMWLLDLRDRSMRRVLQDPTAEEFTWSPDGRRIAFHSRRQGHWGVWVMSSPS